MLSAGQDLGAAQLLRGLGGMLLDDAKKMTEGIVKSL